MQLPDIQDWGLIDYDEALKKQEGLVDGIASGTGVLVFCAHPPTVTLGRKTEAEDVFAWDGPRFEINRGGRATYHGPSQIVIYPIWNLGVEGAEFSWPRRDIHFYLRSLEQVLIKTVGDFGITATNKSGREDLRSTADDTGLWVNGRKLGSIGIGVRKWISFHGIALNLEYDPQAFQGIRPCGFTSDVMVSMEELLGTKPDRSEVQRRFAENFAQIFLN